ncbi:ABC transporter ATP-binding protein [Paenibacillus sonchi]|uniref:ABC transporter ATP-binding protein n=1 Tax=Paenibacillus sonchi TaxID=373687 RepID=UPI0022B8F7B2|nr:ABC transporter ATP-binding protein [Paenibacillus sonchi]MCE3200203.1 ABC transporter ATP-binding protein/permease [Paenibacillus sonchi]
MKHKGASIFLRVFTYVKNGKNLLLFGLILLMVDVAFNIGIAKVQQCFLDVLNQGDFKRLSFYLIVFSICFLLAMILTFVGYFFREYSFSLLTRNFQFDTFSMLNKLPYEELKGRHSGDLISRASYDVQDCSRHLKDGLFGIFENALQFAVALIYLCFINFPLAVAVAITGVLIFFCSSIFNPKLRKISSEIYNKESDIKNLIKEMAQGISVVKAYGLQSYFGEKYAKYRRDTYLLYRKSILTNVFMQQLLNIMRESVWIIGVFLICLSAINGEMTVGLVLTFTLLMSQVLWPFVIIADRWRTLNNSYGSAYRALDLAAFGQNSQSEKIEVTNPLLPPAEDIAVLLRNVSFKPDKSVEEPLFESFDLEIRRGEKVAIVGASGSGKSSLLKLITGLYRHDSGLITIFDKQVDGTSEVKDFYSYVPQHNYLFTGTISENISFGAISFDDDHIKRAAEAANADEFISQLEQGYSTPVKEGGATLSGGQKQRIAIARAMLKNAPLLILDEATSSLDRRNAMKIQRLLESLPTETTCIFVTHSPASLSFVDRIVILEKGRIAASGSLEELTQRNLLYQELFNSAEV